MHVNYCDMGWHLTCSPLLNDATLFPAYLVGSKKEYLIMILLVNTASFVLRPFLVPNYILQTLYLCRQPYFVSSSYPIYFKGDPFDTLSNPKVSKFQSSTP